MNESGGPPVDWDGIFQRARHHIFRRVLLIGGIAALAAVLLFSGGTASWKLVQAPASKPPHHPQYRNHKGHHHKQGEDPEHNGRRGEHRNRPDSGHEKPKPKRKRKPHCRTTVSAEGEYCDDVPTTTSPGG